jgi:serine/threonine-protein kinase
MEEEPVSQSRRWATRIVATVLIGMLVAAVLVARHNVRKGRGDRRGAVRISSLVFACSMLTWLTGTEHFADIGAELDRFFTAIGAALLTAGLLWVLYLALEPYVRKLWPKTLVSWSRLLAGNFLDPQVGRDVLLGTLFGTIVVFLGRLDTELRPALGLQQLPPQVPNVTLLEGMPEIVTMVLQLVFGAVFNSLWIVFGLVAINLVVRRLWVTAALMTAFLFLTSLQGIMENPPAWFTALFVLGVVASMVFIIFRFGLLATVMLFFVNFALSQAVLTLDTSKWFFPGSAVMLLLIGAFVTYGFYASRGGEPLLGKRLLD